MKNFLYLIIIFSMVSCSEDYIGQYPVDQIPPGQVKNPVVNNFAGGSEITYDAPEDEDFLYVKAHYVLSNGKQKEVRASFLQNSIELKGFGRSQKTTAKLIAVDRSQNESQPLIVEIEPEDSPIYSILSSLQLITSWGGLKVLWENPDKENIIIGLITEEDETGEYTSLDNFYSAAANADMSVRGMDSVEVKVGVYVRDRYDNYSDTIFSTHKPLFEMQLDETYFKGFRQSPDYALHATFGSRNLGDPVSVLWDGSIQPDGNVLYIVPGGPPNPYFGMDLGVTAKLSRFKFWSRQAWIFQLHSPKHFQIWGTNDPAATAVDNWDGWFLMLDQEAYRPSGLPPGQSPTSEDKTYAAAGEEYEFDIEIPPVRYIRFRCNETWSGSTGLNLTEIAFWGQPIN